MYRHCSSPVRVVSGRVTDATTAWPIGQARVDDTTRDIFGRTLATTLSSSNGTFRLAIRGAAVGITAPGYQPKVASLRANPLGEIENEEMYVELEKLATPRVGVGPPGSEG